MTALVIENYRLAAALSYAERGWQVFPLHTPITSAAGLIGCSCGRRDCKQVGKHPRTAHGLIDGTTDGEQIRQWWKFWPAANIGIVTGAVSGLIVLDKDTEDGGNDSLAALMDQFGELPETVEAETGGGGAHYLFAHPGFEIKNSASKIGAGLDIRGDGGYIVAPPSLHKSARHYGWVSGASPDDLSPAALPGWIAGLATEPERPAETPEHRSRLPRLHFAEHAPEYWLSRALRVVTDKNRNDVGLWLFCQLRDSGVSMSNAEAVAREYARHVPPSDHPYTEREALRSVESVYSRPPRQPARSASYAEKVIKAIPKPKVASGAAAELSGHLEDVIAGRIFNVPWPWHQLTRLTQALLPGTITVVCGDPGVGKTFFVLDCLQYWLGNDHDPKVFFIEKDRKFHTRRLLAQLTGNGSLVDFGWVRKEENHAEVRKALKDNAEMVDRVGRCIDSQPNERVTLDLLLGWIRQQASAGKRIIVIDPITAVAAGAERWTKDDDFVIAAQAIMTAHGASLVVITHARKGNRPGAPSGHDVAGGAAYFRFSDTTIWIVRPKKPRKVRYQTVHGPTQGHVPLFFQLHKTRDGTGAGMEIAFLFKGMRFVEQGLVLGEVREDEGEAA